MKITINFEPTVTLTDRGMAVGISDNDSSYEEHDHLCTMEGLLINLTNGYRLPDGVLKDHDGSLMDILDTHKVQLQKGIEVINNIQKELTKRGKKNVK